MNTMVLTITTTNAAIDRYHISLNSDINKTAALILEILSQIRIPSVDLIVFQAFDMLQVVILKLYML